MGCLNYTSQLEAAGPGNHLSYFLKEVTYKISQALSITFQTSLPYLSNLTYGNLYDSPSILGKE